MALKPIFMHCLSPMHAGSGQGFGVIDLPIVREKSTGLPYFPGSSIKGCLRDATVADAREIDAIFEPEDGEKHAGGLQISDARLLLFPVRCLTATFLWVTSPLLLERFRRDCSSMSIMPIVTAASDTVTKGLDYGLITSTKNGKQSQSVYLEELKLDA